MQLAEDRFSCEDNLRCKEEINRGLLIDEYDREFVGSWPDRYLTMDPEEVAKELEEAFEPITRAIESLNALQERVDILYDHEREEFDAAKERGYLIDHVTGNDGVLHITYMVWCALMNVPFLEISTESRAVSMMFTRPTRASRRTVEKRCRRCLIGMTPKVQVQMVTSLQRTDSVRKTVSLWLERCSKRYLSRAS